MTDRGSFPDEESRIAATTTFDRNVIVIAGAGTGKTTLLVNRLIHLLMREPDPLQMLQIVALSFTNKAATAMKIRLREGLRYILASSHDPHATGPSGSVRLSDLQQWYGLSGNQITARAAAALRDLEKAQIGTLHSFAAHLLRLYPIEAGVDPHFQTDENGTVFESHFTERWEKWLDQELGPAGTHHDRWRPLLDAFGLETMKNVAYALSSELFFLEELQQQLSQVTVSPILQEWFRAKLDQADQLLRRHQQVNPKKIDSMLAASAEVFRRLVQNGVAGLRAISEAERNAVRREVGDTISGWNDEDFLQAKRLVRIARHALQVDSSLFDGLMTVLLPFLREVRASYLESGWMTFDGLLAGARTLVHRHPMIRDRLKREYRALLIDEFQDTDPVQYEIVLYLAEQMGHRATSWRNVEPEPGKLFIVGDPKQSIYAFRRADIEAFDHVVAKLESSGALICELSTNFRSNELVLNTVNGVFDRLLQPEPNVQPSNVPLIVQPNRSTRMKQPGVAVRLVTGCQDEGELLEGAAATRLEAEQLAGWIKTLLTGGPGIDETNQTGAVQPGDIAILFRKLTQAESYLEALRRHEIPYIMDGEKHFYRRQEVIDLVNVLRAIENPHDSIALLGILRSALGGLPDTDILDLHERQALDYRRADRLASWHSPRTDAVRHLYLMLGLIHRDAPRLPLSNIIDLLFERLPLLELAAASLHGEQAIANLLKVRQIAAELADRPAVTFTGFVDLLIARISEQPEETESTLAEETPGAVRILTIHKAKGLEFPIVVLAGLHHGDGPPVGQNIPVVLHDWSTGILGLSIGQSCSLGAVLAMEKSRARQEAERRRLLYVGMTRARERLILSGGLSQRRTAGALLNLLAEASGPALGDVNMPFIQVGMGTMDQTIIRDAESMQTKCAHVSAPPLAIAGALPQPARWQHRDQLWCSVQSIPLSISPSGLIAKRNTEQHFSETQGKGSAHGRLIGTLAHRLLQYWNFRDDPALLLDSIAKACWHECEVDLRIERVVIEEELRTMFSTFLSSSYYDRLRHATIVGQEVPFIVPWNDGEQIMEGVIDLLYRLDGHLWIVDYKTDRLERDEVGQRAEVYREQATVYTKAIAQSLGQTIAGFQFVFLRHGLAVTM